MKLGFLSAIVPEYTFEQVIDFAAENGLKCVEIPSWPVGKAERKFAGVTHIDAITLDKAKADKINEYLAKKGVVISGIGYYPNPLTSDLEQRKFFIDHIKKCIVATKMLGLKNFNTFVGKDPMKPIADNLAEFKKVWPDIVKFAEENDVKIGIENCPMYFRTEWPGGTNLAASPAIWREMFSVIDNDSFGLNYDPSHLVWQRMDYIKPIYEFKEKIFHIHIKDAKLYQCKYDDVGIFAPPLEYHDPKLPGYGDIEWGKFVSALTDIRYDGPAVIEVEDPAFGDSLEKRLEAILISKRFMKQYIL
jgi:sugar phosphate isomerase/epimerase